MAASPIHLATVARDNGMRSIETGATSARVVGVSPIISGAVVRGMADACLAAIGVSTAADAVALHYGARSNGGVLDGWLVDESDSPLAPAIEAAGIRTHVVPLWMRDPESSAALGRDALAAAVG